MIKIAAVSYINTLPFIHGILNSGFLSNNEFILERIIPSLCTHNYINKLSDIVLVPSGCFIRYPEKHNIITNYGIASFKNVKSVIIVSQKPINDLQKIILDYQSTTSVKLLQILLKHYWKRNVDLVDGTEGFEKNVQNQVGALIIGDKALEFLHNFKHCYDLSYTWWELTKLPFVFAFWAITKNINEDFVNRFEKALKWGIEHKLESLTIYSSEKYDLFADYLNNNIIYNIKSKEVEGLKHFYKYLNL